MLSPPGLYGVPAIQAVDFYAACATPLPSLIKYAFNILYLCYTANRIPVSCSIKAYTFRFIRDLRFVPACMIFLCIFKKVTANQTDECLTFLNDCLSIQFYSLLPGKRYKTCVSKGNSSFFSHIKLSGFLSFGAFSP